MNCIGEIIRISVLPVSYSRFLKHRNELVLIDYAFS